MYLVLLKDHFTNLKIIKAYQARERNQRRKCKWQFGTVKQHSTGCPKTISITDIKRLCEF